MSTATFMEQGHRYEVDGQIVPSVTQVLTLAGLSDVSTIPPHILEKASAIGTAVHVATEMLDQDDLDLDSLDPLIVGYVTAYQRFRTEHEFKPELIEYRGVGECDGFKYGYCLDRMGYLDGGRVVLDIKTSSKPQAYWTIQTAAYTEAINHDGKGYGRAVIHLAKDGSYRIIPHQSDKDKCVWYAALEIAHWRLANGAKVK